jgi:hypothetical protein
MRERDKDQATRSLDGRRARGGIADFVMFGGIR